MKLLTIEERTVVVRGLRLAAAYYTSKETVVGDDWARKTLVRNAKVASSLADQITNTAFVKIGPVVRRKGVE
jgi:hypothetical protein